MKIYTHGVCVVLFALWAWGCQRTEAPPPPPEATVVPSLSDPLAQGVFFDKGLGPVTTGWENQPEKLRAAYCLGCHERAHKEWSEGLHSQAWTDELFKEAFSHEERLWCVHCHAPLTTQRDIYLASKKEGAYLSESDSGLLDEGINCASCHVRAGQILGAHPNTNDDHPVVVSEYLGEAAFCADCHQFNFPRFKDGGFTYTHQPMQDTYREWQASDVQTPCASCHYLEGHRLSGPHDVEWMRSKFHDVEHQVEDDMLLSIRFEVDPRGHITPSGDLFHSLAFEVSTTPDFKKLFSQKRWARFYRRGFYEQGVIWNRELSRNAGLTPEQSVVALTVDIPPQGPVHARLVYHYHDERLGGRNPLPFDKRTLVLWDAQIR